MLNDQLVGPHVHRFHQLSRCPPREAQLGSSDLTGLTAGHVEEHRQIGLMLNLVLDRTQPIAAELVFYQLSPRTAPLAMMVLGLLGLAAVGLLYYRKRHLQGTVEERFKAFREKAVSLMDQLDGLRRRHKTLPATDPDFKVPMCGATLALYNQVRPT